MIQKNAVTTVAFAENLTHRYGDRLALDNLSFSVSSGEILGLLGPNGGGKTTTFRILSTLAKPTSGRASILGFDLLTQTTDVRRQIGVVFQAPSLDKTPTAYENLAYQGQLYGLSGATLRSRIDEVLTHVGLRDRANEKVDAFSGGMRRRVEIAKGLLHRPKLLLLDEPSTGLDPGARAALWDYLSRLAREDGVSCILTTHFMDEAAQCQRVAILNQGRCVALDAPAKLCASVGGDVVTVRGENPAALQQEINRRFQWAATLVDNAVRIEHERGHEIVVQLVEAFPGRIDSVTYSRPTLEDVFVHFTGQAFGREDERVAVAGGSAKR